MYALHNNTGIFTLLASKFQNSFSINYLEMHDACGIFEFGIRYMIFSFLLNTCVKCFSLH
jgi:hypothetical protein